jgi:hypothetical protein
MPKKRKCATKFCRKGAAPSRSFCHSCIIKARKEKDPIFYHYGVFRRNARRRGKEFSLSFEEYKEFVTKHKVFVEGVKNSNMTIDRIDQDLGYFIGNIQVLTVSENSRKRYCDYFYKQYSSMSLEDIEAYELKRKELEKEIEERLKKENNLYGDQDTDSFPF